MKMRIVNKSSNPLPQYETDGSAGMDIRSNVDNWIIYPGETCIVKTGLYVAVPCGYELQIRPRSGLSLKSGIRVANSPGTIDSDYRGEIGVLLWNTGEDAFEVKLGDRIAQMVLCPVYIMEFEEVESLDETVRGAGGFGSTGI